MHPTFNIQFNTTFRPVVPDKGQIFSVNNTGNTIVKQFSKWLEERNERKVVNLLFVCM